MGTELARREDVSELKDTARLLALSGYFDAKGSAEQQVAQLATKILAGRELGYGPFASVQGIHVIQGRPSLSANLMAAAVKGSAKYDYRVRQMDEKACKLEFFERRGGQLESLGVSEFTAEDARKAGTQNMAKYGRNMMFSRAMSNGVKWYCPDVFSGNAVYTPEELGAPVDGNGDVIEGSFRQVNQETGEITERQPEPPAPEPAQPNGNGNGERKPLSEKTFRRLHGLGVKLYGQQEWDEKRHALVVAVSKGSAESSKDLTEAEAAKLIDGMEKKIAAAKPAPTLPDADVQFYADKGDQPFEDDDAPVPTMHVEQPVLVAGGGKGTY